MLSVVIELEGTEIVYRNFHFSKLEARTHATAAQRIYYLSDPIRTNRFPFQMWVAGPRQKNDLRSNHYLQAHTCTFA